MVSKKRPFRGETANHDGLVDHARKKRALYSGQDAKLADLYNNLADEIPSVRLEAATAIIKHLTQAGNDEQSQYDSTLTRLIKGVCSGKKAARLGFSVALTEVFRIVTKDQRMTIPILINKIHDLSTAEGNISGQEKRDLLLGRRFAFQALIQSEVPTAPNTSDTDWRLLLEAVVELATVQPYLRKECGAVLYELLSGPQRIDLSTSRIQAIADVWSEKSLWKTAEGVALWLTLSEVSDVKLPKHVWHRRDPLSRQERLLLAKIMQDIASNEDAPSAKSSGARHISPSFAWNVVLKTLWNGRDMRDFIAFYTSAVDQGLFATSASNERKYLGLQVVNLTVQDAPLAAVEHVFSSNVARCIINHCSNADRDLSAASRSTLSQIVARARKEPATLASFAISMLRIAINVDQLTKTKTIEMMVAQADPQALARIAQYLNGLMCSTHGSDQKDVENSRRVVADFVASIFRIKHDRKDFFDDSIKLCDWADTLLETLRTAALGSSLQTFTPKLSASSVSVCWNRLMSCLGQLLNFPVEYAACASTLIFQRMQSDLTVSINASKSALSSLVGRAWRTAEQARSDALEATQTSEAYRAYALQLLISMCAIQVYSGETDGIAVLEDLVMAIETADTGEDNSSMTMLVEIILSFTSKSSNIYKRLGEQIFPALAPGMDSDSLQSLFSILEQKESKSGQHELFADLNGEEVRVRAVDPNEADSDVVDVEEDSDVEISNGLVAPRTTNGDAMSVDSESEQDTSESNQDDTSTSEDDQSRAGSDEEDVDDDEEAAFDRKLAAALGTAAFDESDEHGSDMDDDQMMALEPHLAKVFQERKKVTSTKQDNKDARENIVSFKSRVLDLLSLYVKTQHDNTLTLTIIRPLLDLIRTSSSKAVAEKAFLVLKQYYDATKKYNYSPSVQAEALFEMLSDVHIEVEQGGSKLHNNACSRSSLFIAKACINKDPSHYEKVSQMYSETQSKWYLEPNSKIQGSFFTEWTSWSLTTRRQK